MRKQINTSQIIIYYLAFLFLGSVVPLWQGSTVLSNNYTLHIRWDYLIHFFIYMPLPVLMFLRLKRGLSALIWIQVILYSVCIGVLFEGIQMLLPYRSFNINDLLANTVGVVLGISVLVIFRKRAVYS
ncbi:MAG: VanZ family protein [Bacteroidota bacterium]